MVKLRSEVKVFEKIIGKVDVNYLFINLFVFLFLLFRGFSM